MWCKSTIKCEDRALNYKNEIKNKIKSKARTSRVTTECETDILSSK